MTLSPFNLKEAEEYRQPWQLPRDSQGLQLFIVTKSVLVRELCETLEIQKNKLWEYYTECKSALTNQVANMDEKESGIQLELEFDRYWEEKRRENLIQATAGLCRQLEKRIVELQCKEAVMKQELAQRNVSTYAGGVSPENQTGMSSIALNDVLKDALPEMN
ncbi:hypothetical protein ANCCAN_26542 [Ancylostoma caninum]|uniref:Uncharacterized protein n=1 Tax=Ancylostoma caninum TaxID=29170 RepID=A0A368F6M8_ANCCA|nr:hypothetical protein ANCCAN_26542 [Ancylostoma caninum]